MLGKIRTWWTEFHAPDLEGYSSVAERDKWKYKAVSVGKYEEDMRLLRESLDHQMQVILSIAGDNLQLTARVAAAEARVRQLMFNI